LTFRTIGESDTLPAGGHTVAAIYYDPDSADDFDDEDPDEDLDL
jgi:elongator complex protein 5